MNTSKRHAKGKTTFFLIVICTLLLSYIAFFGIHTDFLTLRGAGDMRFGIDIRGGVDVAFSPKGLDRLPTGEELEASRVVIETRLDQNNILDRDVTVDKQNGYIFVRFPWKTGETDFDPAAAIAELGSMAHLTFRDPQGVIVLEGKNVARSTTWERDPQNPTTYLVNLDLDAEGAKSFNEATARLVGQNISIFMDDVEISSPWVRSPITGNQCVISDIATMEEARLLSNQINSGALPFSLHTENYSAISPSLGSNALELMLMAGIAAFILICLGLVFYYRLSGLVAVCSLLLQVAGQLILLCWPQFTVTLPGIAGIILSIGMAVDANIISAERIREELRTGKPIRQAVNMGFKQSFSSIFDGNITVLIVAVIMMALGSGAILSFAYTLLFGIVMNFLAGVYVTRALTKSLVAMGIAHSPTQFMSPKALAKKEVKVFPFFDKRRIYYLISGAIALLGVVMILVNGVHFDIQFTGGSIVKYDIAEAVPLDPEDAGDVVSAVLNEPLSAQVTTDYITQNKKLILSLAGNEGISNEELASVTQALADAYPDQSFVLSETNNVAPFFGKHFLQNGMLALALSAALIMLYVWFSFRKIHGLAAGSMALLSLLHDLLVVFFVFVIFRIPIGDSFIAVALTILGYSINDTIVIYDRIRENRRLDPKLPVRQLIDRSISQSFTRSLNTNLAVFASVMMVFLFASGYGLDSIRSFALPMTIGTLSGCYSTICIAGPLLTAWEQRKNGGRNA